MKLKELKELVDAACSQPGGEELEVGIPNNKSSIGSTSITKVICANPGFDWDSGLFIIAPEKPMKEINGFVCC